MAETFAEEVRRLQREIGERQARLHRLVLGDPTVFVGGRFNPETGLIEPFIGRVGEDEAPRP